MPLVGSRKRKGMAEVLKPSKSVKGIVKKKAPTKEHKGESADQRAKRSARKARQRISQIPQEALEFDRVLEYVTHGVGEGASPFVANAAPWPAKPQQLAGDHQLHYDTHDPRLNASYTVHPINVWKYMREYKKFTIGDSERGTDISAGPGDYIMVKNDDSAEDSTLDREAQWKGQVLEIRALDGEHVFIRVAWLNRPEDLGKGGRQSYHGQHELIPTNQMDIVDATTVNGTISVDHWDEQDDSEQPKDEPYYWRQTLDTVNGKTPSFSPLRKICIDRAPINPDKTVIQCGNTTCDYWMHIDCIAKNAVDTPNSDEVTSIPDLEFTDDALEELATVRYHDPKKKRTAYVLMRTDSRKKNVVVVSDKDGDKTAWPLACLHCGNSMP